jgi:hypothetical protein
MWPGSQRALADYTAGAAGGAARVDVPSGDRVRSLPPTGTLPDLTSSDLTPVPSLARTSSRGIRRAAVSIALAALIVAGSGCSRQEADWRAARSADTVAAYEDYLRSYPAGSHAGDAEARLKSLREEREWERAGRLNTPEAYQRYLGSYPEGAFAGEARGRLQEFLLAQAPTAEDVPAPASMPPADAAQLPAAATAIGTSPPPAAVPSTPSPAGPAATVPVPRAAAPTGTLAAEAAVDRARVQLGAFASGEAAARGAWESLLAAHRDLLGPLQPRVDRIVSGGRPLWRLQAGPLSRARAVEVCAALKARGAACSVAGAPSR